MDEISTLESLKTTIREFCSQRDWDQFHTAKDLAIGVSTEANELLEIFRFKNDQEIELSFQDSIFRQKVEHELADVLFFILRFAQKNNIDLSLAFNEKMKINQAKYPAEKAKGSNKKYNEL